MNTILYINKLKINVILIFFLSVNFTLAQSYRGLSVLSENEIWASGSKGTVVHTVNGGTSFDTLSPKGFGRKDFRDIQAFNSQSALIMSAGDSAVFLKTTNHGKSWKVVYQDNRPGIFFDVIEINPKNGVGIALGDPLPDSIFNPSLKNSTEKHFVALYTIDFGDHWAPLPNGTWNLATDNLSSMFAASGTSLVYNKLDIQFSQMQPMINMDFYFAGGGFFAGQVRQVILSFNAKNISKTFEYLSFPYQLNFPSGDGWGIYGMQLMNNQLFCAGGHWKYPNTKDSFSYIIDLTKVTYSLKTKKIDSKIAVNNRLIPQNGYRSGIYMYQPTNSRKYKFIGVSVGSNGIDKLEIPQNSPSKMPTTSLMNHPYKDLKGVNSCKGIGKSIWLVGNKGLIFRINTSQLFGNL
jgi:hypothetical protein